MPPFPVASNQVRGSGFESHQVDGLAPNQRRVKERERERDERWLFGQGRGWQGKGVELKNKFKLDMVAKVR